MSGANLENVARDASFVAPTPLGADNKLKFFGKSNDWRGRWNAHDHWSRVFVCFILVLFSSGRNASAQLSSLSASKPAAQAEQQSQPDDPLGRTTPRGTVLGFLS